MCCYGFSQGWKSLYNIIVYMIKLVTNSEQEPYLGSRLVSILYGLFYFSYTSQEPLTSSPKTHFPKGSGQVYNSSPKHKIRPSLFSEEEVSCYYHWPSCKLSMDW